MDNASPDQSGRSLAGILARCAAEAHRQAAMAARFDDAFGGLALTGGIAPAGTTVWQDLDLHRQSLLELARFIDSLAVALPRDVEVDTRAAIERMTLGAMVVRLTADDPAVRSELQTASGEADFF